MKTYYNSNNEDGSIHCIGNGNIAVYEKGPDIIQTFGPPYSTPSFLKMTIDDLDSAYKIVSKKKMSTAIWEHTISSNTDIVGTITDFTDANKACFIRKIKTDKPIKLSFKIEDEIRFIDYTNYFKTQNIKNSTLIICPPNKYFYGNYPVQNHIYNMLNIRGNCTISRNNNEGVIDILSGTSYIYITGGLTFPECMETTKEMLKKNASDIYAQNKKKWLEFSNRREINLNILDKDNLLLNAIDSVSTIIKTQQAKEGGVLAGYNYHMGYVRDQYGVFRALLKLGYYEEAKSIISFYLNTFKKNNKIQNAQAMGVDNSFHIHENDHVEITGYLILQAFDYLKITNDNDFILKLLPMLKWAFEAQTKNLIKGMLPFNGDETYIAGGILPRYAINDGSCESTLLFIESGKKLISYLENNNLSNKQELDSYKKYLHLASSSYRDNFVKDGVLVANNPKRKENITLPKYRHGVCENCSSFGWTEKNINDRYLCPDCNDILLEKIPPKTFTLQSISMMPLYIGSDMLSKSEIKHMVDKIISNYKKTGNLPSRPDGNLAVGYDYGLLLYNLVLLDHPDAKIIYDEMMNILDASLAWVEYYKDKKPSGTKCRPWESSINLEAAILYMEKMK